MLIKKLIFSGVLMSFLAFGACKNEPAATDAAPVTPEAGTEATTTPTTAAPAPAGAPANSQPMQTEVAPVQTMPAGSTAPAGGSGKINPAHGQPGHSCAVPVGSPLP
ncbi:MAG: hypothetical protein IPM04_08530 [Saprospiraceae bacterium]|nr:hypothetical protein [Candidatus Brachybacter algidus]MBK8747904.1 hypothetical protein [Candidatus Brachybacter algidus]